MPQVVRGYSVWTVRDEMGRDCDLVGYFTNRQLAQEAAKDKGYFGPGNIRDIWIYDVDGTEMYALAQRERIQPNVDLVDKADKARVAAKQKLINTFSKQELEALNINIEEL